VAVCRGIPVTTLARTLVDLAGELPADLLARACHEAGVRYGLTPNAVVTVLARRPRSRGARKALPLPVLNRPAGGRHVDCRWPEHRLTVELDGYRFHNSRHSWEQDRRREREARARGDDFRRYTYGDVTEDPTFLLAELRSLLPPRSVLDMGPGRDPGQDA
jgi:hypothetical protein